MEPDPVSCEMQVVAIHPGVTPEQLRANTGWPVKFAENLIQTPVPTAQELSVLRDLQERTKRAHGV
jgi:glutaconate CoA-transferase subunit B